MIDATKKKLRTGGAIVGSTALATLIVTAVVALAGGTPITLPGVQAVVATANGGLNRTGTTQRPSFGLRPDCASLQVLQWSGTSWDCASAAGTPQLAYYGDGIDGPLNFSGGTVLGISVTTFDGYNEYILNRVVNATTITVGSGYHVRFSNFYMVATGTATINGTIGNYGRPGVGRGGASDVGTGVMSKGDVSGAGAGANGPGSGGNGGGTGNSPTSWGTLTAAAAGANGGKGQGGGGGTAGNAGGTGGAIGLPSQNAGRVNIFSVFAGGNEFTNGGGKWDYGSAGGGGGVAAGGADNGQGGGGGAPGNLTYFAAPTIVGSGKISADGGAGANANILGSPSAGGGGGGGGGVLIVVYGTRTGGTVTFSAAGGAHGLGGGGGGDGGDGGSGDVMKYNQSGDGS